MTDVLHRSGQVRAALRPAFRLPRWFASATVMVAWLAPLAVPVLAQLPPGAATTRVNVASDGTQADAWSGSVAISADGRYVAFASTATNLVASDTNGVHDVFIHDRLTGITTRVSVASNGAEANGISTGPAISADGRYVAFASAASNLVASDTNAAYDVFVHDRQSGATTRVSVASDGSEGNGISMDNAVSGDGRFVAFRSYATNLVVGDTNSQADIFVHDRQTGETTRVSVATDGGQADIFSLSPSLTYDGRSVGFLSYATNLVAGDTNSAPDMFVHDRQTGITERVSVAADGTQGNSYASVGRISGDGDFVAFSSNASILVGDDTNLTEDVFIRDRVAGTTTRVSLATGGLQANGPSVTPFPSADGRYVLLASDATDLVAGDTNGDTDVFVHDRQTGVTVRVSLASDGSEGPGDRWMPAFSANGHYAAYQSVGTNLVPGDTNGVQDVFVTGPLVTQTLTITKAGTGAGTVTSTPAGIACGATCAGAFEAGREVMLAATPALGSAFAGWSGAADCSDGTVTMDTDVACTATFVPGKLLTVTLIGTGAGAVTSTPAGIACPGDCTESFVKKQAVVLAPAAGEGSRFMGWTGHGDCKDNNLTMVGPRACTGRFELLRLLTVTVTLQNGAGGQVTSIPAGIACGEDCTESYPHGTLVKLKAVKVPGSRFVGWTGACTHKRPICAVPMTAAQAATATFTK